MTIVSPFLTFPPVSWWMQALTADTLVLDATEHFRKMTARNRYKICGANNAILLSVPLEGGREQRTPMADIRIAEGWWQVQHWRTLVSVYNRAPYFFHYEPTLRPLFEASFSNLVDLNLATIEWVMRQLKLEIEILEAETFVKTYPPDFVDVREKVPKPAVVPVYHQVFEDRIDFVPDASILDALFCCGPSTVDLLKG